MSKITYVRTQRDKKVAFLLFLFSAILIALIIWGGNVFSKFEQYVDISSKNTIAAMMEQVEHSYQMQINSMYEETERLENYLFDGKTRSVVLADYEDYFIAMENDSVRDIVFVDHTGKYICDDGKTGTLDLGDTKGTLFDVGGQSVQYCTWRNGEEIFVVAKKYEAFYVNENEYEVIAFIYNTNRVNDLFIDSAYGGQAKLYVTNADSMVTYADLDNNEGIVRNYNILDHYLDESVIGEEQYAQITEDFSEGRQNCVTLYKGKNAEYFYYQPLEGTEFFLVFQAPCAVVQSVLTDYQKKVSRSWMVTVVIIACIMLVLAVGTVGAIHMRTWYEYERQTADMHRENNVQLRRMNAVMEETVREYRLAQEGALEEETEEKAAERAAEEEREKERQIREALPRVAFVGERFLLVDDNDMEGLLLQEALTKRGAECTIAKSGEQALKMFKRSKHEKFQYILMDADMPDMDGYQAARRIRLMDHPQAKTIPILAMTYHATPEAMRMAAITGMSGQVEKPVKMQTLALIITKLKSKNRVHPGYDYDRK